MTTTGLFETRHVSFLMKHVAEIVTKQPLESVIVAHSSHRGLATDSSGPMRFRYFCPVRLPGLSQCGPFPHAYLPALTPLNSLACVGE